MCEEKPENRMLYLLDKSKIHSSGVSRYLDTLPKKWPEDEKIKAIILPLVFALIKKGLTYDEIVVQMAECSILAINHEKDINERPEKHPRES